MNRNHTQRNFHTLQEIDTSTYISNSQEFILTAPMLFEKKMDDNKDSEYSLPWTKQTVLDAYKRSGLTVDDIDFFETHDCFNSSEYAAISAFGITKPGKEYEAVIQKC